MLTPSQALVAVLAQLHPLGREEVGLVQSRTRVLYDELVASIGSPLFSNSAVDGYAVLASDTLAARASRPVTLRCIGEAPAGSPFTGALHAGECVRTLTGAALPHGADAMVMVEDTNCTGDHVSIRLPAAPGDHVRQMGEDYEPGDALLDAGTRIAAAEIAILAAQGCSKVGVHRRPRVGVVSTGDELVALDCSPGPGQLRDSNLYAMISMVEEAGAEVVESCHIPDNRNITVATLKRLASAADLIVSSGGVSVGDRDFVKPAVEDIGALQIWRIAMKPGKPLAFGSIGSAVFFGLPGNPVSTMVTFELFVRPALRRMGGYANLARPIVSAQLAHTVTHTAGRDEYLRGEVYTRSGRLVVTMPPSQGSASVRSMAGANCLVRVPANVVEIPRGSNVDVILIGDIKGSDNAEAPGAGAGIDEG